MQVAHISLPMVGETANGDRVIVRQEPTGTLLAVIDGLGHGPGAAAAARLAAECLEAVPLDTPLSDVMELAHRKMNGSRGAAATICMIRERTMEACAVGNVELRTGELRFPLVFSAGILGSQVRKFHVCRGSLVGRARLVLFSDGISSRTPIDDLRKLAPQAACEAIINKYRRKEDDATILVADIE